MAQPEAGSYLDSESPEVVTDPRQPSDESSTHSSDRSTDHRLDGTGLSSLARSEYLLTRPVNT